MNLKDIGGSIIYAVLTVMALSVVFPLVAPGPFSHVLNTLQEVNDFVIGSFVIGGFSVGYWIIKRSGGW